MSSELDLLVVNGGLHYKCDSKADAEFEAWGHSLTCLLKSCCDQCVTPSASLSEAR